MWGNCKNNEMFYLHAWLSAGQWNSSGMKNLYSITGKCGDKEQKLNQTKGTDPVDIKAEEPEQHKVHLSSLSYIT